MPTVAIYRVIQNIYPFYYRYRFISN